MAPPDLVRLVRDAFAADAEVKPAITLRGGDCLDDQHDPLPCGLTLIPFQTTTLNHFTGASGISMRRLGDTICRS